MKRVLDSHALMVYLERELGFEKVKDYLQTASERDSNLMMTSVNWGEIYYIVLREHGREKAAEIERIIQTLPIDIIDVDQSVAKEAANFKAFHKLSYADCFAAGLAKLNKAELITGDREFKALADKVDILWVS